MKKLTNVFPEDLELSKEVYEDFKNNLSCSKLQVIVFDNIISNINNLEVESGISIYDFLEEESYVSVTQPFIDIDGVGYVNPFKEYKDYFIKSNYMELIEDIKSNINDDMKEVEVFSYTKNKIIEIKDKIKEQYGEGFDKHFRLTIDIQIFE